MSLGEPGRPIRDSSGFPGRSLLYGVSVAIVAIALYLPLLGRAGFHSHDGPNPYYRVFEHLDEVRAGHWLPQTYPRLFQGAGYAFPRFYPPLATTVATALAAISDDVVLGVHLSYLLSVVLSAVLMYAVILSITSQAHAAALSALAYGVVPYRFEDVFVRGALAECWSFVWYPVVFAGLWILRERGRASWALAIGIAGLLLSHPPMAIWFALVAIVILLWGRPLPDSRQLLAGAAAVLIALGATAWYWLPQQYYLPSVWASVPAAVWADAAHVVADRVPLGTVLTGLPARNGLTLSIGVVPVAALLLAARSRLRPAAEPRDRMLEAWGRRLLVPWAVLFVFLVAPGPLLGVLPDAFGYIQFPWRVLGPMAFLAAGSLGFLLAATRSAWPRVTALALVIGVAARAGVSPDVMPDWTGDHLHRGPARYGLTGTSEYLPRTVRGLTADYSAALDTLTLAIVSGPRGAPGVLPGAHTARGSSSELSVIADRPGALVLPLVYYDFYAATLDGARLPTRDSLGLLTVTIPPGRHLVRLEERLTPIYWIGFSISAGTLLACALVFGTRRAAPCSGSEAWFS